MALRSPILNLMLAAAEKAARGLVRDFGEVEQLQVSKKGPADFVSNADINAEKILKEELAKARPDYAFLMEESGVSGDPAARGKWIVDPLDGTSNFLHGVPHWCISIGLEYDKEIVAGLVYDPVKNETFMAERGGGAYLNNRRLRVSGRTELGDSMIATCVPIPSRTNLDLSLGQIRAIANHNVSLRRLGSAALDMAYVAAGRYEAYWEMSIKPWDIAAGMLLVTEAGGYVSEAYGGGNPLYGGSILAANPALHTPIAQLLQPEVTSPGLRRAGSE